MKTQNNKLAFQKNAIVELNAQQLGSIESGQNTLVRGGDPTIISDTIIVCTIPSGNTLTGTTCFPNTLPVTF